MGNTPSAQHGSPARGSRDATAMSPNHPTNNNNQHVPSTATTPGVPPGASAPGSSRNPNLRLPMPSRAAHISPQSSNPTSPSGRSGSPRRRKSLELPDLNKLSFTPAAPVPTIATATSHVHGTTPGSGTGGGSHSPSSLPTGVGTSSATAPGTKRWQQVLGGRTASPLANTHGLTAMSKLDSGGISSSVPAPKSSAPVPIKGATAGVDNYFPGESASPNQREASPRRPQLQSQTLPIPIPSKDGAKSPGNNIIREHTGASPPPPTATATPPSRAEIDIKADTTNTLENDDGLVNVPIQWTGGGKNVYVTGNFADNWKGRIKLKKSTHDFNAILRLPPGQYRLKFIVDDSWRCSKQISTATDDDGTLVNWIEVEAPKTEEELKAEWAMDAKPAAKQEATDETQWSNIIPPPLVLYQYIEELPSVLTESEFDTFLRSIPYLSPVPQPPTLPRILDKVIVNAETKRHREDQSNLGFNQPPPAGLDDNSILAVPNHVVLNHLTASAIKNGTLGVGTTTRYRKKYITTMYFKPTIADMMGEVQGGEQGQQQQQQGQQQQQQ